MKKAKQIGALLLTLFLLIACVPSAFAAETESVLRVGTAGGQRGETVSLEVTLDAVNGIAAGGFDIVYDTAALTLVSAAAGDALTDVSCTINPHYGENTVRVSFADTNPIAAGALLILTFTIRSDAALGDSVVKAEQVKLMDVDSEVVTRASEDGAVTVQSVAMKLSSAECLAGQSVKLEVLLEGPLAPCGGAFELHYNAKMLSAGSVKAEEKLGGVAISLSAGIDNEAGVLKVSWAASEPAALPGKLCTVIFQTAENAAGTLDVTFDGVKFYNDEAKPMAWTEPEGGAVTIVSDYNNTPTLYLVGGVLDEETNTARVQIAVDGAGVVCGGKFRISYDTSLCTLKEIQRMMGCVAVNPENAAESDGSLLVSWAEDSPALDNEAIVELLFQLTGNAAVPLTISDASLKDDAGETIDELYFDVHSGKIGVRSGLQDPIADVAVDKDSVTVDATLYDAMYCLSESEHTSSIRIILAGYAGGKLLKIELPPDAIEFDEFGIAHLRLDTELPEGVEKLRVFFVDSEGGFIPMCKTIEIEW